MQEKMHFWLESRHKSGLPGWTVQECVVCVNESAFDPYQSPHLATHAICRHCLQIYVHGKVVKEKHTKIICPGPDCKVELTYEEIRANSESDTFAIYDQLLVERACETDPNFKFCANTKCGKGQLISNIDEASFFSCMACRVKTCLSCAVKFHSGITCADYKESQKEQTFSEVRSKGWLSRNAKLCVCGRWVWKTEGCDHITCVCGKEWCYICGVSYKLIGKLGNAAHKKNCKHYRSMHSGGPTPIQM